jgi:hypothetical protein
VRHYVRPAHGLPRAKDVEFRTVDDARLIALSRAANPQAFAALVERHQRDVRAFI